MPEIDEIEPLLDEGDVSDDDLIVIFDVGSDSAGRMTRGSFLNGVARDGGDHDFGTSEITDLTATNASISALSITGAISMGDDLSRVLKATASVSVGDIAAGAGQTVTMSLTGCLAGDALIFSSNVLLPDGLHVQAWISATNTVSIRFHNSTGSTITAASYSMTAAALRIS